MTEKGKLHQLLAVEQELKAAVGRESGRITSLFKDGKVRLMGHTKTYEPIEESGETFPPEVVPLATTVEDELSALRAVYATWIDAVVQKEVTNQSATAEISLDEPKEMWFLPATAFLNLEKKLAEIRQIYDAIPTLDPTKVWEWSKDKEAYEAAPEIRFRTKKLMRSHVAYEATPEHPAQVENYTEDVRVGFTTSVAQSGTITLARKRQYLERIDELIKMVKKARQEANTQEVTPVFIGGPIFDYIHAETDN
jgi:hypothetical protein